jgi:Fic family protein
LSEGDRHSVAETQAIITDPDELARREVENGIRQFNVAMELVKTHVNDPERPFKLRSSHVLMLNHEALRGIHPQAGTYRNTKVHISKSKHQPPEHYFVAEEVEAMCGYVNARWSAEDASPLHLAAYLLWRLNWIHPFADGNGRTSRVIGYLVLSIRLNSVLPGAPTIADQIAGNKQPYYQALEKADEAWATTGTVDVSEMEKIVDGALAQQLVNAVNEAAGH